MMELPDVDSNVADAIIDFIRRSVQGSGCSSAVIGLSGGLDSALVTKLAVDALGPENVLDVFMPSSTTPADDHRVTSELCRLWNTEYKVIDVTDIVSSVSGAVGCDDRLRRGNIAARCRMTILYDQAKARNALVIGTSNLSERMMGYFTKFGDGACDISPISKLYKTQVRQLAEIVGVPKDIIDKPPSAGLWEGQTDEDEMGMTYLELDRILACIDNGMDDESAAYVTGSDLSKIASIRRTVMNTEHKRIQPPTADFNTLFV